MCSTTNTTGPALNLDNRTQLDTYRKIVVVRDYGSGCVEVGMSNAPNPNQLDVKHEINQDDALTTNESDELKRQRNIDRSLRRSKANVRRKVMSADLDYMLTLTYKENMTDLEQGWNDFRKYIRKVRRLLPNYKYVVVAEYQKRGAVHFHIAVKGWQPIKQLQAIWHSVVGQGMGNVRYDKPKFQIRYKWQLAKIAGYLSKYITKSLGAAFARQRYRVSEGIIVPGQRALVYFQAGTDWIGEIFDSVGAEVRFRHESEQGWAWACSW